MEIIEKIYYKVNPKVNKSVIKRIKEADAIILSMGSVYTSIIPHLLCKEIIKAIDNMNDDIISEMNKAVAYETGSINAKASVKSNNSMLNVIQASISLDGSVEIDGQKAGKLMTPYITKTLRTGGAT